MHPSSSSSATLWLELENDAQRRIFELRDNEIVTLGAGKYASFRLPKGAAVGAHFEARGPLVEMVRGYSNKLTLNGSEVEGRALLVGKGNVECDGGRVVVSVHQSRPPYADELGKANESHRREEDRVQCARTEDHPRADVSDYDQETVAVHLEQEDTAPTRLDRHVPLAAQAGYTGSHFEEPEGMETAAIGTVPDFAQVYPGHDEQAELKVRQIPRSDPPAPAVQEPARALPHQRLPVAAFAAPGPQESEHTECIPLGDFAPPTPSSSAIPAYLSPLDENRPEMGSRMQQERHKDGRFSSPHTPSPPATVRALDDRNSSHRPPAKAQSLRRLLMSGSERVGRLSQQRPLFAYGAVAVGAFFVSMMLLGISSLLGREPSKTNLAGQEHEQQQQREQQQPASAPPSGDQPGPSLQHQHTPKPEGPETEEAKKNPNAAVSRAPEPKQVGVDPEEEKVTRSRELDEAVKHLLSGRYDRAESAYAALSKKFPDETAASVLYELLKRRNASSKGNSHDNSSPVILP